jgi:phospholipase C
MAFMFAIAAAACGGNDDSTSTAVVDGGRDGTVEAGGPDVLAPVDAGPPIGTVFVFLFENHNWLGQIKDNPTAPYINSTLLQIGAHAEQYYNPPLIHPSLPNYLWIVAGDSLGVIDDDIPAFHTLGTSDHLVDYLERANISWKAYEEDIDSQTCPLVETATYAPKHDPFVYFSDVTNGNDPKAPRCLAHIRPYSELANDLAQGSVARFNFITPNLCHDMHDCAVAAGDAWLMANLPPILASPAYTNNGAIFITWDEGEDGDGPVGMIALSPKGKPGYSNAIHYDHSSLLKTLQEIFGVAPLMRHAADPTTHDLGDLFWAFP